MRCRFTWRGAVPDPEDQARAVKLYRALFDPAGLWPEVRSDGSALEPTPGDGPTHSPTDGLFGVAPYLSRDYPDRFRTQGQLVFDRSSGGRIVSIADPGSIDGPRTLSEEGRFDLGARLDVRSEAQAVGVSIFLHLLRDRCCPRLESHDDGGYLDRVGRWLAVRVSGETGTPFSGDARRLCCEVVHELRPGFPGETDADSDDTLGRPSPFDFLPICLDMGAIWGLPRDPRSRMRSTLELLAGICRDSGVFPDPDAEHLDILVGLCRALNRVWRAGIPVAVVQIQGGAAPEILQVLHHDRGRGVMTEVPVADIRHMLRRIGPLKGRARRSALGPRLQGPGGSHLR